MTTIQVSQADIAAVFELWEREARVNPQNMTPLETAKAMSTVAFGEASAVAFIEYLHKVRGEDPVKAEKKDDCTWQ